MLYLSLREQLEHLNNPSFSLSESEEDLPGSSLMDWHRFESELADLLLDAVLSTLGHTYADFAKGFYNPLTKYFTQLVRRNVRSLIKSKKAPTEDLDIRSIKNKELKQEVTTYLKFQERDVLDLYTRASSRVLSLLRYKSLGYQFVKILPEGEMRRRESEAGNVYWVPCLYCIKTSTKVGVLRIDDLLKSYAQLEGLFLEKTYKNLLPYHINCACRYIPLDDKEIPIPIQRREESKVPIKTRDLASIADPSMLQRFAQYVPGLAVAFGSTLLGISALSFLKKNQIVNLLDSIRLSDHVLRPSIIADLVESELKKQGKKKSASAKEIAKSIRNLPKEQQDIIIQVLEQFISENKEPVSPPTLITRDPDTIEILQHSIQAKIEEAAEYHGSPPDKKPTTTPSKTSASSSEAIEESRVAYEKIENEQIAQQLIQRANTTVLSGTGASYEGQTFFRSLYVLLSPIRELVYDGKLYNLSKEVDLFDLIRQSSLNYKAASSDKKKHLFVNIIKEYLDSNPFLGKDQKKLILSKVKALRASIQDTRPYRTYTRKENELIELLRQEETPEISSRIETLRNELEELRVSIAYSTKETIKKSQLNRQLLSLSQKFKSWEEVERFVTYFYTKKPSVTILTELQRHQGHINSSYEFPARFRFKKDLIPEMEAFVQSYMDNYPGLEDQIYYLSYELTALFQSLMKTKVNDLGKRVNPLIEDMATSMMAGRRPELFWYSAANREYLDRVATYAYQMRAGLEFMEDIIARIKNYIRLSEE